MGEGVVRWRARRRCNASGCFCPGADRRQTGTGRFPGRGRCDRSSGGPPARPCHHEHYPRPPSSEARPCIQRRGHVSGRVWRPRLGPNTLIARMTAVRASMRFDKRITRGSSGTPREQVAMRRRLRKEMQDASSGFMGRSSDNSLASVIIAIACLLPSSQAALTQPVALHRHNPPL